MEAGSLLGHRASFSWSVSLPLRTVPGGHLINVKLTVPVTTDVWPVFPENFRFIPGTSRPVSPGEGEIEGEMDVVGLVEVVSEAPGAGTGTGTGTGTKEKKIVGDMEGENEGANEGENESEGV